MLLKSAVKFKHSSGLNFLPKLLWGGDRGREGYGRWEKKGREGWSLQWRIAGLKFKKESFRYLSLLTSSQRNEPNVSWLPFNVFRPLKQNLYARKVKKWKFILGIKKNSITSCEIGNLSKLFTSWDMNEMAWHTYTCVELIDCVSRVSVSSVSLAVEILRKNNKASQVKCRQRPFWSVSVFFGVVGKNPSMEDLPGSLLRSTVVHKTLKILLRGVNLCWRNAA